MKLLMLFSKGVCRFTVGILFSKVAILLRRMLKEFN